ncbi:hypothetical protein [Geobacter anodireducens]
MGEVLHPLSQQAPPRRDGKRRLRVKNVDFERRNIIVREEKWAKDRVTMLPRPVALPLREHLTAVKRLHGEELLGHKDVQTTMIYTPCAEPGRQRGGKSAGPVVILWGSRRTLTGTEGRP